MLAQINQVAEPSALIKWMYALIIIGVILAGAAIGYGISKLINRIRRS